MVAAEHRPDDRDRMLTIESAWRTRLAGVVCSIALEAGFGAMLNFGATPMGRGEQTDAANYHA